MKPQDIIFLIVLVSVIFTRNPKYAAIVGILCLIFAIPLFQFWIFFTAQRLVMYAAAFFLLAIIFHIIDLKRESK